nr:aminotransferase [Aquimixticola soesokkakensis]
MFAQEPLDPLNPAMAQTAAPPVMEARRWLEGVTFTPERPLINVSQAAPVAPPPHALRAEMARVALEVDEAHLYGPVLGLPALRAEVARQWSVAYRGPVRPEEVAITSGCNEAFAAVMATIAGHGDEVLMPVPWYFNHKMWCDMNGVKAVPIATGDDMLPTIEGCARHITPRTRAIVLVTPNNPAGVEYPPKLVDMFYALAKERDLALVVDETYRDFDSRDEAPHAVFQQKDWGETLIQLYSFSKAYRLTGHRVGAIVASDQRLAQVEKYLDTVTICPNQIAQYGALYGMQHMGDWVAGERDEILKRRAAIEAGFADLAAKGWALLGCGAYFAYLRHPFDIPADQLAPQLVRDAGVLCLPGTMFRPKGDKHGAQELRLAFANLDVAGIATLFARLAALSV